MSKPHVAQQSVLMDVEPDAAGPGQAKAPVDKTFRRYDQDTSDDDAIVLVIIQMGHSLNLQVIAEGVETAPQLAYLRRHLCDQIQGFYFSPPLPVPALELLLLAHTSLTAPDGDTTVSRHGSWASSGNVSGATDVPARRSCSPLGVVEGQQALTVDPD